ncbi:hypothetical protein HC762_01585, partial [bacterium]|nr:hypothetical protein [bacterium]
ADRDLLRKSDSARFGDFNGSLGRVGHRIRRALAPPRDRLLAGIAVVLNANKFALPMVEPQAVVDPHRARRIVIGYLNATGDLTRLCEMACLDARGPAYSPELFVAALGASSFTYAEATESQKLPASLPELHRSEIKRTKLVESETANPGRK